MSVTFSFKSSKAILSMIRALKAGGRFSPLSVKLKAGRCDPSIHFNIVKIFPNTKVMLIQY